MYGGTCINIACLPSIRLIIEAANGVSYVAAVNGKNEMTAQLREKNYHMLADEKTITVLDGKAHFIADHEIEVELPNGKKAQYKGDRIFINTGAVPVMLPIPGLKESKYILDSTQAMDEKKMPKNLTIIGAGYIGLEFASMFAKYGSKVTVLDHNKEFLVREDEDISNAVRKDMEDAGIKFEFGADIEKITDEKTDAKVTYQINGKTKAINADRILVATGRKPNTENLGLENTAIETTDRGAIKVDDFLRTTVDNVWAIGDVKGGLQFTYISLDDFRIIKDQLFGTGARMVSDRKVIPYSVFISPALSQVGLNEKQANKLGKEYKLFKLPVTAIPKAKVAKDNRGLFKALVDPETEKILGATLYGIESYELINMISLAMKAHLSYTVLRDQIYTHPTMTEALNDVLKD